MPSRTVETGARGPEPEVLACLDTIIHTIEPNDPVLFPIQLQRYMSHSLSLRDPYAVALLIYQTPVEHTELWRETRIKAIISFFIAFMIQVKGVLPTGQKEKSTNKHEKLSKTIKLAIKLHQGPAKSESFVEVVTWLGKFMSDNDILKNPNYVNGLNSDYELVDYLLNNESGETTVPLQELQQYVKSLLPRPIPPTHQSNPFEALNQSKRTYKPPRGKYSNQNTPTASDYSQYNNLYQ